MNIYKDINTLRLVLAMNYQYFKFYRKQFIQHIPRDGAISIPEHKYPLMN